MKYLSAFAERIYADGGYYDDTVPISERFALETLKPSPVTFLTDVFPSEHYVRASYKLFGGDAPFLNEVEHVYSAVNKQYQNVPRSVALSIQHCIIHKSVIYRPADDGLDVLHETYRSNDRPWTSTLDFANSAVSSRSVVDDQRTIMYLGSVGSSNYGHWLIDDLGRAKLLNLINRPVTVILNRFGEKMDRARQDSINMIMSVGADITFEWIGPDDTVHCRDLTYVTPISYHPVVKNPKALNFVRDTARARLGSSPSGHRRIFVKRSRDRYRRMTNVTEIETLLVSYGFVSVDPEQLSYRDQVEIFSHAELLVGIMCAAMANTIFCRPSTKVIYLAPSGWQEPFYWDLASVLQHEYTAVYGKRAGIHADPFFDDFLIDPNILRQALSEAGMS
ncbi:MAG: hypothetical protein NVS2B5_20470 [Beijerinckiaceae bacterium]